MSRQILVLDSSQIAAWGECNQYWNLKYNENLTSSNEIREDMAAGTYGHKLLELYYTNIALGLKTADAWHDANMFHAKGDFPLSIAKREFVHKRCWEYVCVYAQNDIIPLMGQPEKRIVFGPHLSSMDHEFCVRCGMNREQVINQGPLGVCPQNPETKLFPKPLVEQGFSYPLLDTPEYLFVLEGRIDVMATLNNGSNGIVDHKFQGRERSLYGKSIQFRNYAMVSDFNYVVVNYIRLHQAISEKTFVRDTIYYSSLEKQIWKRRLIEKYKKIAHDREVAAQKIGHSAFEKEESACSGKFGYPCEFTKICNDNFDLVSIQAVKEQFFKKREVWKPW
jgi:hypothetical protein